MVRVPLFRYGKSVTTVEEGEKDRYSVKKAPWTLSGFCFDATSSIDLFRLTGGNRLEPVIFIDKSPDMLENEIREVSSLTMKGLIAFLIGEKRARLWTP